MTLAIFAISLRLVKNHWSVALAFFATAESALYTFAWRDSYETVDLVGILPPGQELDLLTLVAIGKVTAYTFSAIVVLVLLVREFTEREYRSLSHTFAFFCIANSLYFIAEWLVGKPPEARGGLFGNSSMSGCLTAFTYPFLVLQEREKLFQPWFVPTLFRYLFLGAPVLAVILTTQSQPMGVLCVVIGAWYLARTHSLKKALPVGFVAALLGLFILWLRSDVNNSVFSNTGRFGVWRLTLHWWWEHGRIWLGQGTGVTQVLVPALQRAQIDPVHPPSSVDWWLWLHSDWVQLLFENGVVGASAVALMYVCALRKAWGKKPWVFAAVVGIGATSIFNFTVHFPVHCFIAVVTLGMAFHATYEERKTI